MKQDTVQNDAVKIALLGNTGVGKGTFASFLEEIIEDRQVQRLKLAKPLYDAQQDVYDICGVIKQYDVQDGELLNFLGAHMRKINPKVLEDCLRERLTNIDCDVVVCDDARPKDVAYLKELGFIIVEIITRPEITGARRELRGDVTLGSSNHSSENGQRDIESDYTIINESTIEDFRESAERFVETAL